jgi:hypothetical protein
MSELITPLVKTRLETFGAAALGSGLAENLVIGEDDGIRLTANRRPDGQPIAVEMTGTTEVYRLDLGGIYKDHEVAYELEDKLRALDELLGSAWQYLEMKYHEEICEIGGRVIYRKICFDAESSRPPVVAGSMSGLLGCKRTFVRPI